MTLKEGFALRQVGDNHIVVPVGAATLDFRCIITLNETGAFMWRNLQQGVTGDALIHALLEEYDVAEEVARRDVDKFINDLREAQLLDE